VRRSECERAEVAGQVGIAPSGKGFLVERESDGRVLWPPAASSSAAQSDQLRRLKLERVYCLPKDSRRDLTFARIIILKCIRLKLINMQINFTIQCSLND
jgi:hypothetical protein